MIVLNDSTYVGTVQLGQGKQDIVSSGGSGLGQASYKSSITERSYRVECDPYVQGHHNLDDCAYAFVHRPMEGNSTLGKLVMARRDSLQDFETTPRPLRFAPPLHFPPKETTTTSSQSCMEIQQD